MSGTPYKPTLLSFFYPYPRVCTYVRVLLHADVITKISGIDRLPFSLNMGLRCALFTRAEAG